MKIYKNSERLLKVSVMIKAYKSIGAKVKTIGTWCKWKETNEGKIQLSLTIYEVNMEGHEKAYMVEDALGRLACELTTNKKELNDYLKDHGYLPEKKWYIEEGGMTEELWNIWNGKEETEE